MSECVSNAPKIPGTLEVHKISRSFNSDGVRKIDVYGTAADDTSFHELWYRRDGDREECCHPELPLSFDSNMICAKCRLDYKKNENEK